MNVTSTRLAFQSIGQKPPGWSLDTEGDWRHDGVLVGANSTEPGDTPLDQIDAFLPRNGREVHGTAVMVNGIMSDLELQRADLQALADLGYKVVGVHNATKGMLRDVLQCAGDKLGVADNKAVETTSRVIQDALREGKPLHLVGHSQGALIASRALGEVVEDLQKEGLTGDEAREALSPITLTTIGGSSWTFPEGPTYHHVYNNRDLVPLLTGRTFPGKFFSQPAETFQSFSEIKEPGELPPWKNGWVNRFARYVDATTHGARDVYIPHLKQEGFLADSQT